MPGRTGPRRADRRERAFRGGRHGRGRAGQDDGSSPSAEPAGWPAPGNGVANGTSPLDHPGIPQGLGLAVIAGLADDVQFARTAAGLSIKMSWPSDGTG